ncbi:MAG: carbon starvation CstA family protein, partial [Victivallaceae bacterium]
MNSLLIAAGAGILYLIAYYTYGRFLGKKIFKLAKDNVCPSVELNDGIDFVPSKKEVLFGHHFASIAGTGPIVGPALAVIWGWLPALIWILVGSIFMGAVHDFGALVISLRNQGRSIGDIAGDMISKRVKLLFLMIIFLSLLIVIAIFSVIIGVCFDRFPESVWPVWLQIPIAVVLGILIYRKNWNPTMLGLIAVALMYATILFGSYHPVHMEGLKIAAMATDTQEHWKFIFSPVALWVILLLFYVYIASTISVKTLLQPRD